MSGGKVLHGMMMGLLSAGSGSAMMRYGGALKTGAKLAIQSVIGGTLSELGGGNFANGAITAAFSFLFNETKHRKRQIVASHSDCKPGMIQTGQKTGSVGNYGTNFSVRVEDSNGRLTIYVGATAYTECVQGDAVATVVYTLSLNGKDVFSGAIDNNSFGITNKSSGRRTSLSGSAVLAKVNSNNFNNIVVKAQTTWIVSTALGANIPHLALPIGNLFVPVVNKWEYKIK